MSTPTAHRALKIIKKLSAQRHRRPTSPPRPRLLREDPPPVNPHPGGSALVGVHDRTRSRRPTPGATSPHRARPTKNTNHTILHRIPSHATPILPAIRTSTRAIVASARDPHPSRARRVLGGRIPITAPVPAHPARAMHHTPNRVHHSIDSFHLFPRLRVRRIVRRRSHLARSSRALKRRSERFGVASSFRAVRPSETFSNRGLMIGNPTPPDLPTVN